MLSAAAVPNLNTPAVASNGALALRAAGTSVTNWQNTSIPIAPVAIPLGRASYLATVRSRPVTRSVSAQNARAAAADTESESTISDSEEPELTENEAEYTDVFSTSESATTSEPDNPSESADSLNLFYGTDSDEDEIVFTSAASTIASRVELIRSMKKLADTMITSVFTNTEENAVTAFNNWKEDLVSVLELFTIATDNFNVIDFIDG